MELCSQLRRQIPFPLFVWSRTSAVAVGERRALWCDDGRCVNQRRPGPSGPPAAQPLLRFNQKEKIQSKRCLVLRHAVLNETCVRRLRSFTNPESSLTKRTRQRLLRPRWRKLHPQSRTSHRRTRCIARCRKRWATERAHQISVTWLSFLEWLQLWQCAKVAAAG